MLILLSFFVSFTVGEHWEGKGKSQPPFYMGGKGVLFTWLSNDLVSGDIECSRVYSISFVSFVQNSIGGVSHLSGDHVNEPFM